MVVMVKAIYREGVFEPIEPVEGLVENQAVELQVWPASPNDIPADEQPAFWSDPEGEAEWAAMSPWERLGRRKPNPTPEEIEARVRWVHENSGSIRLSDDQLREIAMSDALLEESQDR